jgi:hypothetical protein
LTATKEKHFDKIRYFHRIWKISYDWSQNHHGSVTCYRYQVQNALSHLLLLKKKSCKWKAGYMLGMYFGQRWWLFVVVPVALFFTLLSYLNSSY